MNLSTFGEFGLIRHLSQSLATRPGVRLGIGDDVAVLEALARPVVTCDALIENVHFRRDWTTARALGRKAMAVNVSDLAASGAEPVAAFVALGLPPETELSWIEDLYAGFEDAAAKYGFTVAGGDTVRSPTAVSIAITLIGSCTAEPVTRGGARGGDILLVSGTLGDAAAGLALLQQPELIELAPEAAEFLLGRHHEPRARLREMRAALAVPGAVTAGLDLSDGLAGDAAHIARASGVGIEIELARLPISNACRQLAHALGADPLQWALYGGEDYELLWCAAPDKAEALAAAVTAATGTPMTAIGKCLAVTESEAPVVLVDQNEERAAAGSAFKHF